MADEQQILLVALERIAGRLDAFQTHVAAEFSGVRADLGRAELRTAERLQALETDRARWFDSTWPEARAVMDDHGERLALLERGAVATSTLAALTARLEKAETRVRFLEDWRMKLVGLAAGVGVAASIISTLILRLVTK